MCLMSLHIVQGTISPRGTTEGIAGQARNDNRKQCKPHFHLIFSNKTTAVAICYLQLSEVVLLEK